MTKDAILGWFLVLLVGASLFLSFLLWYQTPGAISIVSLDTTSQVDLASVIGPEKILIRFGDSTHTLLRPSSAFYDKVWNFSRRALASQWSTVSSDIPEGDLLGRQGIAAHFATPIPANALRQLVDVKPMDPPSLDGKLITSYIVTVEDQRLAIYFEDQQGQFYKFAKTQDLQEYGALLRELSESRPPLFARLPSGSGELISHQVYVSVLAYELPTYSLQHEDPPGERQVAEYFSDFSVVRKIHEKDGATIYTDGQKGLRVNQDGSLEYSYPGAPEAKKTSFYDALSAAVNFVNRRGGWPRSAYLASYNISDADLYTFKFRLRVNGYPVLGDRDYLTVQVGGQEIKSLWRNIVVVEGQTGIKPIDTPVKALDTAVAVKNIRQIDDIYPAYLLQGDELLPRWVVKTGGMEVVLPNPSE